VPLTLSSGLEGFAYGMAGMTLVNVAMRTVFLSRLFPAFAMGRHMLRAMAPSIPAVAAVILARMLYGGERTLGLALSELALYAIVTVAATIALERTLLREVWSYLRARPQLEAA